jgi:hypothetical protein
VIPATGPLNSTSARPNTKKYGFPKRDEKRPLSSTEVPRVALDSGRVPGLALGRDRRALRPLPTIGVGGRRNDGPQSASLRADFSRGGLPAGRSTGVDRRLQTVAGGAGLKGVFHPLGAADRSGRARCEGSHVWAEPHRAAPWRAGGGVAGAGVGAGRWALAGRSGRASGASQELGMSPVGDDGEAVCGGPGGPAFRAAFANHGPPVDAVARGQPAGSLGDRSAEFAHRGRIAGRGGFAVGLGDTREGRLCPGETSGGVAGSPSRRGSRVGSTPQRGGQSRQPPVGGRAGSTGPHGQLATASGSRGSGDVRSRRVGARVRPPGG